MKKLALIAIALVTTVTAVAAQAPPLVMKESRHSVKVTLDRLVKALGERGIGVVARVDHAAGAKAAGMELPPTEVVIFGNPKLGTPLMKANPEVAIDLPMRVVAWQDKAGKVWIGYTPPETLKARYGITGADAVLKAMTGALEGLTAGAAKAE